MLARTLKFALLGALVVTIPELILYASTNNPTGNRNWVLVLLPIFALVGAIVGALGSITISAIQTASKHIEQLPSHKDPMNVSEWENPANWSAGIFYHSRADKRVFVPKRVKGGGYTVNLGNSVGRIILLVVIATGILLFALDLLK